MDALSTTEKKKIEKDFQKISNTLISKAEGYVGSNHLLHDLRLDYNIDGHQLARQCGFSSFEEFMVSKLMQRYAKVEGHGADLLYKPAYDSRMQHIVDEMLKSRSDVLKRNELKESRERARNINNKEQYASNTPVNLFWQNVFDFNSCPSSSFHSQNNHSGLQRPGVGQQQTRKNGPLPLMSILIPQEKGMYRNRQQNKFTALQGIRAQVCNTPTVSNSPAACLSNRHVSSTQGHLLTPFIGKVALTERNFRNSAKGVTDAKENDQQQTKEDLEISKKVYNPLANLSPTSLPSSNTTPASSILKRNDITINWNLDKDNDQEEETGPIAEKNKKLQNNTHYTGSSDEWDFGEFEISSPTTELDLISSQTASSSPYPSNGFVGAKYHRGNNNQRQTEPKIVSPPTLQNRDIKPEFPIFQPRKICQTDSALPRRLFQRAPYTSPPTDFAPSTSAGKLSSTFANNPTLWLGDLEKKKLDEEQSERLKMAVAAKSASNSLNHPSSSSAFMQKNKASGAFTATDISRQHRSASGLASAAMSRNFGNKLRSTRNLHMGTSYNGTGYRTKEEYDNRLELSDSD